MTLKKDREILRGLAAQLAEAAALPIQEEKRRLWRGLNGLRPERPMVMIDQVCWNEMNIDDELTLRCSKAELRAYEETLRQRLYQWKHFPVDMPVEPIVFVPMAIRNSGFGLGVQENIAVEDPTNSVVGHYYLNQIQDMEDVAKLKTPRITHDAKKTERRMALAHEIFDGLLEPKPLGMEPDISIWDPISTWMGVEGALYGLADKPEMMHAIVRRMVEGYMSMLDQLEEKGLLCQTQYVIHCTGAYTDELPAPGYNPAKPRLKDIWVFGLAQMFSTVSPKMFKEYEVDYISPLCARIGMVYYGCCDPLDGKMDEVRLIPNVRKVSMSPWTNQERGAERIHGDYVFSRKPNPAFLAFDPFDAEAVEKDLRATKEICERHKTPLELILKDISTVHYDPQRLFKWAEIAMRVVQE